MKTKIGLTLAIGVTAVVFAVPAAEAHFVVSVQCIPYNNSALNNGVCAGSGNGCKACILTYDDGSMDVTYENVYNHLTSPDPWNQPEFSGEILAETELVLRRDGGVQRTASCAKLGLFRDLDRRSPKGGLTGRPARSSVVSPALVTAPAP